MGVYVTSRYCSKLYGRGELKELICDWCLHERESSCKKDRNTRQMKTAQYNSREEPTDLKPSSDNQKGKGGSSTHNVECVNEPPAAAISNNNENPPQHSSQRKGMVGGKDKIIKQRYRYKSLAKILSVALRI